MALPKLALLLALAVGARAADDDQVVVGQTFMAGAIDPTSGSTGWALDATRVDHAPSMPAAVDIPLPPRRRTCYFGADSRHS